MTSRVIAYLGFLILLAGMGYYRASDRKNSRLPKAVWLAAVDLPANTRITTHHLQKPAVPSPVHFWRMPDQQELIGKYTLRFITNNHEVTTESVGPLPSLGIETNQTLISLPPQDFRAIPVEMNAGAKIFVHETDTANYFGPYRVEAVFGRPESLTVMIRVADDKAAEIQKLTKIQLRLASLP